MATHERPSAAKGGITDRIKQDGRQKIESTKRSAADQIDQVAQALSRAGAELHDAQPTLANYAGQFASTVSRFANRLREGNMEDLVNDTRELARRNPALYLLGGVAVGFALSRFLKASGDDARSARYDIASGNESYGTSGFDDAQHEQDLHSELEPSSYTQGAGPRGREGFSGSRTNGG